MKKLIVPIIAIAVAFSASAFTVKKSTSAFFVYTSSLHTQAAIQDISNYKASTATCPSGANVCGVSLTTAKNIGQEPNATEFSNEEGALWASQQDGSAQDGNVEMKN